MKKLKLKLLKDFDFKDKNVFMRVDFNVPLRDKKIVDAYRIEKAWPSILWILEKGGRLLLASHLGRPGGKKDPQLSLKPVAKYLSETKKLEVFFVEEPDSEAPRQLLPGLKNHQVILLENLRFHPGEETEDKHFAKHLAAYTNIYINEGFGISHRKHTSVTLLPSLLPHKGLGLQYEREIEKLDIIRTHQAKKPFFVILGGSKLRDKIPLMESLIDQTDGFLIGGLMAYTILKAMGKSVGDTPVEPGLLSKVNFFIERLKGRGKKIFLPLDHIIENKGKVEVLDKEEWPPGAVGRDIGPRTLHFFQKRIQQAQSIFWNGPMGFFEKPEFCAGTQGLAQAIAEHKTAYRVVGGGHSALAVRDFEQDIDHVSTGGGASLSYLRGEMLPGLQSLISEIQSETEKHPNGA